MKVVKAKDYQEMCKKAALCFAAQITLKPDSVLGLATGSTPIGMYDYLTAMYERGELDFSAVRSVNLDEYVGLPADSDQSYRYFMNKNLFDRVNINKENTHVPNGLAADTDAECLRYETVIQNMGGIDMQVLGIGLNGHIGFNEPDETFPEKTHCVNLTQSTIDANARFFKSKEEVPTKAISMGIGSIFTAKKILLLANGKAKADIIYKTVHGGVTPSVPASILRFHPDVTVFVDEEAGSLL